MAYEKEAGHAGSILLLANLRRTSRSEAAMEAIHWFV